MGSTGFRVSKIGEPRPIQRMDAPQIIHEDHEIRKIEYLEDKIVEVPVERVVERVIEVPEICNVEKNR